MRISQKVIVSIVKICLVLFFVVFGFIAKAQPGNPEFGLRTNTYFDLDLNAIALVDLEEGSGNVNLSFDIDPPTEAGVGFDSNPLATSSDLWLNYTSVVPLSVTRSIQVSISSGSLPNNFSLTVSTASNSGIGGGNLGTAVSSPVTISSTPQNIITNIGGAYTGTGVNNGHQLTYELNYNGSGFSTVFQSTSIINILYTIIDD